MRNKYVILLVDDPAIATAINLACADTAHSSTKVQAFSSMTQMVGLRHRETRPTHIIDLITDRSHEKFDAWYESQVGGSAVKAKITKREDE